MMQIYRLLRDKDSLAKSYTDLVRNYNKVFKHLSDRELQSMIDECIEEKNTLNFHEERLNSFNYKLVKALKSTHKEAMVPIRGDLDL